MTSILELKTEETLWCFSANNLNKIYTLHGPFGIKIIFNKDQVETFGVGKPEPDIGGFARLRIKMKNEELISFERLWKTKKVYLDDDVEDEVKTSPKGKAIAQELPYSEEHYPYVSMEYGGLVMSLPDHNWYETMVELGHWVHNWCKECLHDMKMCGWKKCSCSANGYFIVGKKQK